MIFNIFWNPRLHPNGKHVSSIQNAAHKWNYSDKYLLHVMTKTKYIRKHFALQILWTEVNFEPCVKLFVQDNYLL